MVQSLLNIIKGITNRRVQIAVLVFVGLMVNYMLRININIALVEMTNPNNSFGPYVNWTDYGGEGVSEINANDAEGFVKSAFFIGYVITQVPGGRMAELFGTKKVFGFCMFCCGLLGLLTPLTVNFKSTSLMIWSLFLIRMFQGLFQGVCFPALNPLVAKWSPDGEKGKFMSFSYLGGTFGAVVTYPLCGIILAHLSWSWVFYITSGLTMLWFVCWQCFMYDDPEYDPLISTAEKELILRTRKFDCQQVSEDLTVPLVPLVWDIIKTPAVWVCMLGDFCNGFGLYVLLTEGPDFIANILPVGKSISANGWIAMLPYLSRSIMAQVFGTISDFFIGGGYCERLTMQKICASIGFMIPAIGMVTMSYLTSDKLQFVCIGVLSISFGFNGAILSGHIQNILGLAPNRSGTLYGVTNGFGNLSGYIVPLLKTWVVQDTTSIAEWRDLFLIAAALYIFITVVFCLFASRDVQKFNNQKYDSAVPVDVLSLLRLMRCQNS